MNPPARSSIRLPLRSQARTVICRARGTRPRTSGMLRHPSQSSTCSVPAGVISGLISAISGTRPCSSSSSSSGAGAKPATNTRSPTCTCGAASPTPWYSFIVSNMSSMSFWNSGERISAGSTARARARSTGWPIRATLRIALRALYSSGWITPRTASAPRAAARSKRGA